MNQALLIWIISVARSLHCVLDLFIFRSLRLCALELAQAAIFALFNATHEMETANPDHTAAMYKQAARRDIDRDTDSHTYDSRIEHESTNLTSKAGFDFP